MIALRYTIAVVATMTVGSAVLYAADKPPPPKPKAMAPGSMESQLQDAYEFRLRLIGSGDCPKYGSEADSVVFSTTMTDVQKADVLRRIGAMAQAANCLSPR